MGVSLLAQCCLVKCLSFVIFVEDFLGGGKFFILTLHPIGLCVSKTSSV